MIENRQKQSDAVCVEVALNGAAGQGFQPLIPITATEIIAQGIDCAKAGASVVHLHAYNDKGQPCEDVDIYQRIIEGIKEKVDVIVYPTIALYGDAETRYAPFKALAKLGLLEWGVVDPGSVNITHRSQIAAQQDGLVYQNPDAHIRYGLELAQRDGWRPAYAIYEPGFARLGAALASQYPTLQAPIYRIMFSDNLLFGMPPTLENLEFYAGFLRATAPGAPWMLSGLDADVDDLIVPALELGAHIRVGLEDAPFGCQRGNVAMVEDCVTVIEAAGYQIHA